MRSVALQVCQRLMVVSYCIPGSPHFQADLAISWSKSRARNCSTALPSLTLRVHQSLSSSTARMKSSVTRILEEHGRIRFAVDRRIITLLDQNLRLALFLHLGLDEFHDVGVIHV